MQSIRSIYLLCAICILGGAFHASPAEPKKQGPFEIVRSLPISEPTWGGKCGDLFLVAAERSVLIYRRTGAAPSDYAMTGMIYPGHDADIPNCVVSNGMLYLGAKTEGVLAYRQEDLKQSRPQPVLRYMPSKGRKAGWVAIQDGRLYVAYLEGGLAVLDRKTFALLGEGLDDSHLTDFAIGDGAIYARSGGRPDHLTIVDVRDPQALRVSGTLSSSEYPIEFWATPVIARGKLYMAEFNGGLAVYSLSDALHPKLIARDLAAGPVDSALDRKSRVDRATVQYLTTDGKRTFTAAGETVNAYRMESRGPEKAAEVFKADKRGGGLMSPTSLFLEGNMLAIPTRVEGFRFYDVSNIEKPELTLLIDLPSRFEATAKVGRMVYSSTDVDGVWQVDWEAKDGPALARRIPLKSLSEDLTLWKNHLYVANGTGLATIDVSDETNPREVDYWDFPYKGAPALAQGWVEGVDHFGSTLYVVLGHAGLGVFDLADPDHPKLITILKPTPPAPAPGEQKLFVFGHDVTISPDGKTAAYGGTGACVLIDVSNPAQPKSLAFIPTKSCSDGKFTADGKTLITCEGSGIQVFDIAKRSKPVFQAKYPCGASESVLIFKGYLLAAGRGHGIDVFKIGRDVSDLKLVQNIPSYFYNSKFFVEGDRIFTNCQGLHELRLVE